VEEGNKEASECGIFSGRALFVNGRLDTSLSFFVSIRYLTLIQEQDQELEE
jgi:hypothetical protein